MMSVKKTGQTKKLLKLLNNNECCIECPFISDIGGNIIQCLEDGIYASANEPDPGEGLRFGFAGEDDVAGEARSFDAGTNPFTITGFGNGLNLIQTDGVNWLNGLGINDVISQLTATDLANNTKSVLSLAPNGQVQLRSTDIGNGIIYSIDIDFLNAIYLHAEDGINYAEMQFYTVGAYTGAYIDVYDDASGDEIYMEWEGGSTLAWQFLGNAIWHIEGIVQDDTAPQIIALDSNGDVRWIDPASLAPDGPLLARRDTAFVSTDGMSGGGAAIQTITGLSLNLDANTRYEIEIELFMEENGSGPVEQFHLEFDNVPVSGQLSYELVACTPVAITDPLSLAKGVGVISNTIADVADFGDNHLASGHYKMRITGVITTSGSATVAQVKTGVFASTGAFAVYTESYIKATKLTV